MIDKRFEPYYDILFSIFIGIFIVIAITNMYECPVTIYKEKYEQNSD